jgi:hypothetical protein
LYRLQNPTKTGRGYPFLLVFEGEGLIAPPSMASSCLTWLQEMGNLAEMRQQAEEGPISVI